MKLVRKFTAAGSLLLGLLMQVQAGAIVISVMETNGQDVGNLSGGTLSFDIRFTRPAPVVMDMIVENSDSSAVTLHGNYANLSNAAWSGLNVALTDGAKWRPVSGPAAAPAAPAAPDAPLIRASGDSTEVDLLFPSGFASPGVVDLDQTALVQSWSIDTADLFPGDHFQVRVGGTSAVSAQVPEPGILALLLPGVIAAGAARRRSTAARPICC